MSAPQLPLREAAKVWAKVAIHSFGGPAGQIAFMHRILVEERRWLSEKRFLHALNFCMLLPGPEAMQLATYTGWLKNGVRGGLLAGGLFVLPGFLSILALSALYVNYQGAPAVAGLFFGIKAAVVAVVVLALWRIGRKTLRGPFHVTVAVAAFAALFFFNVPFPIVIAAAALAGYGVHRFGAVALSTDAHGPAGQEENEREAVEDEAEARDDPEAEYEAEARDDPEAGDNLEARDDPAGSAAIRLSDHGQDDETPTSTPGWRRSLATAAIWLTLWWTPVAVTTLVLGTGHVLTRMGLFFSQVAVVTFGGAYAVLAYITQRAVEDFGWVTTAEMVDGLGMAEATPGPLIQVLQHVGFLGAFRDPGGLDPWLAAVLAALLVSWVLFMPCFLFIFVGAPYMEALRRKVGLGAALAGVTAAVVGVIANLALWFALHVLFGDVAIRTLGPVRLLVPTLASLDWWAVAIMAGSVVALARFKVNALLVLGVAAGIGVAVRLGGVG